MQVSFFAVVRVGVSTIFAAVHVGYHFFATVCGLERNKTVGHNRIISSSRLIAKAGKNLSQTVYYIHRSFSAASILFNSAKNIILKITVKI
jgi:hypothetical protein